MTALAEETRAAEVVLRLRSLLGSGSVLSGADVPVRNRQDWSTLDPVTPLAVVRPADSAGVAAALRVANEYGIAVVPQGGLTGLAGGARPIDGALALSTERLVGIEEIDLRRPRSRRAPARRSRRSRRRRKRRGSISRSTSGAAAPARSAEISPPTPAAIASSVTA